MQLLEDSAFSDEFCRFLQSHVPSVEAAELLLALAADPQLARAPDELGREAGAYLRQFQAAGLLQADADGRVRYRPQNETVRGHVATLAQAYKERPVTLFRVIYALRN